MKPSIRQITPVAAKLLLPLLLLAPFAGLRAQPRLDASSPVSFFTNCANLLLNASGYNFTVTNIPVFDGTNLVYSPAVYRLLQFSANIYDCTTNRAFSDGSSPNGPYYPSVFRPTFGRAGNVIFINGFVEEGDGTTSFAAPPLSLPQDLALVDATTTNIYGVPWVIGARKGFPNFNQVMFETVAQITRRLQVDKIVAGAPRTGWRTNQMYIIGISNLLAVQSWNSYSSNYSRAVRLIGACDLSVTLTNDQGILVTNYSPCSWIQNLAANEWPGFADPLRPASDPARNSPSFTFPLQSNLVFLPDSIWRESTASLVNFSSNGITQFEYTGTFPLPRFGLTVSNRVRYIMLDTATGRVLDYVHFDAMNTYQDLLAESAQPGSGVLVGNGAAIDGAWNTNRPGGSFDIAMPPTGVINQMSLSMGVPALSAADWYNSQLPGANSMSEIPGFVNFLNTAGANASNLVIQAPYTPTRKMTLTTIGQANDPLVHYHFSDLGMTSTFALLGPATTTNISFTNLSLLSTRYQPWLAFRGTPSPVTLDLAVSDPYVRCSDDWNFPSAVPLDFRWLGQVHRGTPWQTFYLKSSQIDLAAWTWWTGYTNPSDAWQSLPANDWKLAARLVPILDPTYPRHLVSVNQTDAVRWDDAFTGLTVLTNASGVLTPLVIDPTTNADAISTVLSAIAAQKLMLVGGIYTGLDQILAVPALSVSSPFVNTNTTLANPLTDAAYEALPAQLLPLLRTDSVGTVISSNGPLQIQFTGYDGFPYVVEGSTDLVNWTALGTNYTTNGVFTFTDAVGSGKKFYRTRLGP